MSKRFHHRKMDYRELIHITTTMAETIGAFDKDFVDYAGAPFEIGKKMALIKWIKDKVLPEDHPLQFYLDLYYDYLIQLKKAIIAGESSELTKLGFLSAGVSYEVSAKRK